MRLADAIDLFNRRSYGLLDEVCEVWVSVERGVAQYTVVVPDSMDYYNKSLVSQRLRRALDSEGVKLTTCHKSMFVKRYTMFEVYP